MFNSKRSSSSSLRIACGAMRERAPPVRNCNQEYQSKDLTFIELSDKL